MRIFFSGSARGGSDPRHGTLPEVMRQAARELGHAAALAGHTLLVATDKPDAVDPYVVEGAERLAGQAIRPVVEVHRIAGRHSAFASAKGVRLVRVEYSRGAHADERLAGRSGAVAGSDVVCVLGGSELSQAGIELAERLGRAVIPIASFGGVGEAYLRAHESALLGIPGAMEILLVLGGDWQGERSVKAALALADLLAGRHDYYLSCAPRDAAIGDHMEALLARYGRRVLRLERPVSTADARMLAEQIASAATFISVWSHASGTDTRCALERELAARSMRGGDGRLRRGVVLRADDAPLPGSALNVLPVATRSERESAARSLVLAENHS